MLAGASTIFCSKPVAVTTTVSRVLGSPAGAGAGAGAAMAMVEARAVPRARARRAGRGRCGCRDMVYWLVQSGRRMPGRRRAGPPTRGSAEEERRAGRGRPRARIRRPAAAPGLDAGAGPDPAAGQGWDRTGRGAAQPRAKPPGPTTG